METCEACKTPGMCGRCLKGGLPIKKEPLTFLMLFFLSLSLILGILLLNGKPHVFTQYGHGIRFVGLSLLDWTGILLAIAFVLNFATCFALPWSQLSLPWKGSRPGPDPLDSASTHMRWATVHKYFAWATVIIGIIHGVIAFMQMFGYPI